MPLVDAIALLDREQGARALASLATDLGFAVDDVYVRSSPVPVSRRAQVMPLPSGPMSAPNSHTARRAEVMPLPGPALSIPLARRAEVMPLPTADQDFPMARGPEVRPLPSGPIVKPLLPPVQETDDAAVAAWPDYPIEFVKAFVENAKNLGASSLKGAGANMAAGISEVNQTILQVMDRIDRGEHVPELEDTIGYQHMTPDERRTMRAQSEPALRRPVLAQENPLYRAGEAVEGFGKSVLGPGPGFHGRTWTRDIGGGLGSAGAGIALSLLSPTAAMLVFVTAGQGEAANRAIKAGATPEQVARAARLGTVAGASDMVDIALPALGSMGRVASFIKRVGAGAIRGAFAEGGQEGLQQLIQNAIAQGVYDPTQDLWEDVPRSAVIGAIVGGNISGGTAALSHGPSAIPIADRAFIPFDDLVRRPSQSPAEGIVPFNLLMDPSIGGMNYLVSPALLEQPLNATGGSDVGPQGSASGAPPLGTASRENRRQSSGANVGKTTPEIEIDEKSRFAGYPREQWAALAEMLVDSHLLKRDEIVSVAHSVYEIAKLESHGHGSVFGTRFGKRVGEALASLYPGIWRPGNAGEKDVVCITDPSMSFEIKTSSDPNEIVGNRSYALHSSMPGRKSKSGWVLAVNRQDSGPPRVRFGWLDRVDWEPQASNSGQQARVRANVRDAKMRDLYGPTKVRKRKPRKPNRSE